MIKLYGMGLSFNVNKVRYCLNYLGLDYEWVQTDPMKGENQTPDYFLIAPTGKIPAIDVDGFKLFESNAINKYLAKKEKSDIYPSDFKRQAVVDAWTDYGSVHIGNAIGRILFNRVLAPMLNKPVDENSLKAGEEFMAKYLPVCDKQLGEKKYIAGVDFTVADINLLAILDPCELGAVDLESYKNVVRWREELKSQDFYQKCYKDFTKFIQEAMNAQAH